MSTRWKWSGAVFEGRGVVYLLCICCVFEELSYVRMQEKQETKEVCVCESERERLHEAELEWVRECNKEYS